MSVSQAYLTPLTHGAVYSERLRASSERVVAGSRVSARLECCRSELTARGLAASEDRRLRERLLHTAAQQALSVPLQEELAAACADVAAALAAAEDEARRTSEEAAQELARGLGLLPGNLVQASRPFLLEHVELDRTLDGPALRLRGRAADADARVRRQGPKYVRTVPVSQAHELLRVAGEPQEPAAMTLVQIGTELQAFFSGPEAQELCCGKLAGELLRIWSELRLKTLPAAPSACTRLMLRLKAQRLTLEWDVQAPEGANWSRGEMHWKSRRVLNLQLQRLLLSPVARLASFPADYAALGRERAMRLDDLLVRFAAGVLNAYAKDLAASGGVEVADQARLDIVQEPGLAGTLRLTVLQGPTAQAETQEQAAAAEGNAAGGGELAKPKRALGRPRQAKVQSAGAATWPAPHAWWR